MDTQRPLAAVEIVATVIIQAQRLGIFALQPLRFRSVNSSDFERSYCVEGNANSCRQMQVQSQTIIITAHNEGYSYIIINVFPRCRYGALISKRNSTQDNPRKAMFIHVNFFHTKRSCELCCMASKLVTSICTISYHNVYIIISYIYIS